MFGVGGVEWDMQPLGQMSDAALAHALGVTTEAVKSARRYRGIPAWDQEHQPRRRTNGEELEPWKTDVLGRVPDRVLASAWGVTPQAVAAQRKTRGIPPAPRLPCARPAFEMIPYDVPVAESAKLYGLTTGVFQSRQHSCGVTKKDRGWVPKAASKRPLTRRPRATVDWASVDWTQGNMTLAREHDVSPTTIAKRRREIGAKRVVSQPDRTYAILNPITGLVKIGISSAPARRVRSLSAASGVVLSLLGDEPGGKEHEQELHARFSDQHAMGEWFRFEGAVREWAAQLEPSPAPSWQ